MQAFFASYSRLEVEGRGFGLVGGADDVVRVGKAVGCQLGFQLGSDAGRGAGIGEETRAERDIARARGEQLERVAAPRDSTHADDRHAGRLVAGVDRSESERPERRARKATGPSRQNRAEGALVERQALDGVHEAEPSRAGRLRNLRV